MDIDVRFEAEHEASLTLEDGRPMLTYARHLEYGYGWFLWYLDDPESDTAGVEEHFIPGDLTDVDRAVESARAWLLRKYGHEG